MKPNSLAIIFFSLISLITFFPINGMEESEDSGDEQITTEKQNSELLSSEITLSEHQQLIVTRQRDQSLRDTAQQIAEGKTTISKFKEEWTAKSISPEEITIAMKRLSVLCGKKIARYDAHKLQLGKANYLNLHTVFGIGTIPNITTVTKLNLSSNFLTTLEGLEDLSGLTMLDLSSNDLTIISPLSALVNLQHLYLNKNKIPSLEGLKPLVNLKTLEAHDNLLETVDVSTFTDLHKLVLTCNNITVVQGLQNLSKLKILQLWNNKLPDAEKEKIKQAQPNIAIKF